LISQSFPINPAVNFKQCYLGPTERTGQNAECVPFFYFEARIDFSDVRSGARETFVVSSAVDIFPLEGELRLTADMVRSVDPACVQSAVPAWALLRPLPDFVDAGAVGRAETQFLQYLMQYFKMRIFRNFALNLYSSPGATLQEFKVRCLDMLAGPFRQEVDRMYEVFERKLEQTKAKYISLKERGEFDPPVHIVQFKTVLHKVSERIAQLFLGAELSLDSEPFDPPHSVSCKSELEERLISLEVEARQEIARLIASYQEKIRNIDEYIVHPSLKDIHLVRSCILWTPAEE
jgi:hypothetical protein